MALNPTELDLESISSWLRRCGGVFEIYLPSRHMAMHNALQEFEALQQAIQLVCLICRHEQHLSLQETYSFRFQQKNSNLHWDSNFAPPDL